MTRSVDTDPDASARWRVASLLGLALVLVPLTAAGCDEVSEPPGCVEARLKARQAADKGKTDQARALLDKARARCREKSAYYLHSIEEVIADKEEEVRLAARRDALLVQEQRANPVRQFLQWVKTNRDEVPADAADISCAPRGSEGFGFCEGHRPGDPTSTVRFWEADRDAYCFHLSTNSTLSCQDLGEHRIVGTWSDGGKTYELCEPMGHELRSLSALLTRSAKLNELFVYSQAYVRKNDNFKRLLDRRR